MLSGKVCDYFMKLFMDGVIIIPNLPLVPRLLAEPLEGGERCRERGQGEHEPLPRGDGQERGAKAAQARPRATGRLQGRRQKSSVK